MQICLAAGKLSVLQGFQHEQQGEEEKGEPGEAEAVSVSHMLPISDFTLNLIIIYTCSND